MWFQKFQYGDINLGNEPRGQAAPIIENNEF